MQREVVFLGPSLASLLNECHGVDLDVRVIHQLVHVVLRSHVDLQDLTLTGSDDEVALDALQTRCDGSSVVAGVGCQYSANGALLVRFVLEKDKPLVHMYKTLKSLG